MYSLGAPYTVNIVRTQAVIINYGLVWSAEQFPKA